MKNIINSRVKYLLIKKCEIESIIQYYTPVKRIPSKKHTEKYSANTTDGFQNKPGHYAAFDFTQKQEY